MVALALCLFHEDLECEEQDPCSTILVPQLDFWKGPHTFLACPDPYIYHDIDNSLDRLIITMVQQSLQ